VSPKRHRARLTTVVFLRRGGEVLLLRHPAEADRFAGRWDGIGGHVEAGEDILAAARRELSEEAGVEPEDLELRGVIHETGLAGADYVVFLFVAELASGDVRSPEDLELAWHPEESLESLPLVEDLHHWLRPILDARAPLFLTERYDGADGLLSIHLGGRQIFAREASARPRA
jgi:8-oxo-dGTP diphosphatase